MPKKKEKLPNFSELIKVLEDEQLRFSNKNRETANYACNSNPKKAKLSEQSEIKGTKKGSDNEGEKKKQEVEEYKIYKSKYHRNC